MVFYVIKLNLSDKQNELSKYFNKAHRICVRVGGNNAESWEITIKP